MKIILETVEVTKTYRIGKVDVPALREALRRNGAVIDPP